jgi:hypothetical protein
MFALACTVTRWETMRSYSVIKRDAGVSAPVQVLFSISTMVQRGAQVQVQYCLITLHFDLSQKAEKRYCLITLLWYREIHRIPSTGIV